MAANTYRILSFRKTVFFCRKMHVSFQFIECGAVKCKEKPVPILENHNNCSSFCHFSSNFSFSQLFKLKHRVFFFRSLHTTEHFPNSSMSFTCLRQRLKTRPDECPLFCTRLWQTGFVPVRSPLTQLLRNRLFVGFRVWKLPRNELFNPV